ncbi:MAG: TRAP transporter large permease [Clostridiales Family XIII bacterium]|nr:TRAP transporter large permease [Clostridiales Family XIII bacterium]
MEWWLTLILILGSLFVLMLTGYPVVFVFLTITFALYSILMGGIPGIRAYIISINASLDSFTLVAIPMFVLMGEALFQSGIAMRAIDAVEKMLGKVPGRLGILAAGTGVLFGAVSGSMSANTAMLGGILTPEMQKRGYDNRMIFGPIMGGGSLAMLIPPSSLAILFASIAEISAGKVLMAGTLPGVLLGILYAAYIVISCKIKPSLAPAYEVHKFTLKEILKSLLLDIFPLFIIIFIVIGSILLGLCTPTEAAALGAVGTIFLCIYNKTFGWKLIKTVAFNTFRSTVMILSIMAACAGFGAMLSYTGVITKLATFAISANLSITGIVLLMGLVVLILGTFMDSTPLMMIIIPIFYPIINKLGIDPIWFATFMLISIKIGNYSPPYGMLLFVMKGISPPGTKTTDIYRSVMPFNILDCFLLLLLVAFPSLALILPNLAK